MSKRKAAVPARRKLRFSLTEKLPAPLDLEAHLPFRIAVLANLLQAGRDPIVRSLTDLGGREVRVLLNVGSYQPTRAADLSYHSRLDDFTVSRGARTLIERGLVKSERDAVDRRTVHLELTRSGQELYRQISETLERRSRALEATFKPDEVTVLIGLLERLEDRAEEVLAGEALELQAQGQTLTADQKDLIKWFRRGQVEG